MDTTQQDFESWYLEGGPVHASDKTPDGCYKYAATHTAWGVWQAAAAQYKPGWIPTAERMPVSGMLVLADIGQEYPIRAFWVEKFGTEVVDDYDGTSDYNEANDTFYWPEGWYENNLHEATHWLVEVPVLRWRALENFLKEKSKWKQ